MNVKRDERRLNTAHREKLLLAIGLLRQIETVEDLDTLQREADEFLRETLTCYDDGAIEEGDLLAYSLVLDQFHNAIVEPPRRDCRQYEPSAPARLNKVPGGNNLPQIPHKKFCAMARAEKGQTLDWLSGRRHDAAISSPEQFLSTGNRCHKMATIGNPIGPRGRESSWG